jgi:hypothetical protein
VANPKKHKFTPEQEKQITELYLSGTHKNPEIGRIMGFTRAILNYAIAFFALSTKFKEKFGTCKTQYMISQINKSTDNPECPRTGKEAIRHWYIEKGLTAAVIGVKLGLKLSTVKHKIRLYGLNNQKVRTYTPKERIKDLTSIITDIEKPRQFARDFRVVNKVKAQPIKSKIEFFQVMAADRKKVRHLLESDLSALDITQLTATTCRGINTNDDKDTFCLTQIDPSQTYCQHHRAIYYARQVNNA